MSSVTTARWEDKTLMVRWYGQKYEDEAAFLIVKKKGQRVDKPFRLIFDGNNETFVKDYPDWPSPSVALEDIISWQNKY